MKSELCIISVYPTHGGRVANSYKKEIKTIVKAAESQGCVFRISRKNSHGSLLIPGGGIVVFSSTPSDSHAVKNFRSDLRRAGIRV